MQHALQEHDQEMIPNAEKKKKKEKEKAFDVFSFLLKYIQKKNLTQILITLVKIFINQKPFLCIGHCCHAITFL